MRNNFLIITLMIFSISVMSCGNGGEKGDDSEEMTTTENAQSDVADSGSTEQSDQEVGDDSGSNCDDWLDDYESYIDDYIVMLKKYQSNPTDMSIMQEYQSMMQKAQSMSQNTPEDCASDAGFVTKMAKISAKMSRAAGGM